ncbi:MAG: glycosyltransferase 87 family protein [Dermatophilaceae bacterium]
MTRLLSGAVVVTVAYVGLLSVGDLDHRRGLLAAVMVPFWLICVASTFWVVRGSTQVRRPIMTVALLALAVQLPGVLTPPHSSSDAWRYVWDGRVQLSGTSPYRYVPLDDRLAGLRDPILFPGLMPDQHSGVTTAPLPADRVELLKRATADDRTLINRPQVPTLYPPVAQLWFAAVAALTPWSAGTLGLQIGGALLAIAVAGLLAAWLRRRGHNPFEALWWAWCPTVILETGNGAHVDVLVAALAAGAVVAVTTRPGRRASTWVAGLLLGAAAAVKLTPLVLLPAFFPLRNNGIRRSWKVPSVAVGTLLASYAPHVLVAGGLVLGYLPGYLLEEGGPNRGGLLRPIVPDDLLTLAMLVAMGAVTLWAVWTTSPEAPHRVALVLFGSLLLITTPSYPWYSLPLVPLAVLSRRLEWLVVPVAGYIAYAGARVPPVGAIGYAVAAAVVIGVAIRRRRRAAPSGPAAHASALRPAGGTEGNRRLLPRRTAYPRSGWFTFRGRPALRAPRSRSRRAC